MCGGNGKFLLVSFRCNFPVLSVGGGERENRVRERRKPTSGFSSIFPQPSLLEADLNKSGKGRREMNIESISSFPPFLWEKAKKSVLCVCIKSKKGGK